MHQTESKYKKKMALIIALLLTPLIIFVFAWLIITDAIIRNKFETKSFSQPSQFFASPYEVALERPFNEKLFLKTLNENGYREKNWGSVLQTSDFSYASGEVCQKIHPNLIRCYAFHDHTAKKIYIFGIDEQDIVRALASVDNKTNQSRPVEKVSLSPQIFAQYLGSSPILQTPVPLSQIPRQCLDAALAIEDPDFLEHQGISWRGFFRALWVNIKQLRFAQGGSTVTQQLVKNHFLSAERTVSRKFKEMIMATLVEFRVPKDEILETYLNIIYLGQQGNFQIRGYQSAAKYYFQKDVTQLDLSECSLLAAIVNSPGRFNPFRKRENALKRRTKVLTAMLEQKRILSEDFKQAMSKELPTKKTVEVRETAPYFIGGVKKQLAELGFNDLAGYRIYTTIDLSAQSEAQIAVQNHLQHLENTSPYHIQNSSHSLQSVLISSDTQSGEVRAMVGGRNHRETQYNRALDSSRQVGSIFKPFVYLAALGNLPNFTPLSPIDNSKYVYKYDKQIWAPQNYDKSVSAPVPAFYALKESMNIPTARLGVEVGLDTVINTANQLGINSSLKAYPSISLGAFELKPYEVLQAYTNIARLGNTTPLRLIKRIENQNGELIFEPDNEEHQVLNRGDIATLVSMLKETMRTGTGRSITRRGFKYDCAGKTGTTSDYKDAWFAGFTPNHVAIVWTGYDDNTPVKLSGASGALPIWANYMKNMSTQFLNSDFNWPTENKQILELSFRDLVNAGIPAEKATPTEIIVYE